MAVLQTDNQRDPQTTADKWQKKAAGEEKNALDTQARLKEKASLDPKTAEILEKGIKQGFNGNLSEAEARALGETEKKAMNAVAQETKKMLEKTLSAGELASKGEPYIRAMATALGVPDSQLPEFVSAAKNSIHDQCVKSDVFAESKQNNAPSFDRNSSWYAKYFEFGRMKDFWNREQAKFRAVA